jgi:hypothetical protein
MMVGSRLWEKKLFELLVFLKRKSDTNRIVSYCSILQRWWVPKVFAEKFFDQQAIAALFDFFYCRIGC